jgi:hypothetical protein
MEPRQSYEHPNCDTTLSPKVFKGFFHMIRFLLVVGSLNPWAVLKIAKILFFFVYHDVVQGGIVETMMLHTDLPKERGRRIRAFN